MDYKYIDQLVERYWLGETTLEEEQILRTFFSQKDVPAELERYRALFIYEQSQPKNDVLGSDFDERVLAAIGREPVVKARVVTISQRFAPLFKAAAIVAIILTFSQAVQMSFRADGYENVEGYEKPAESGAVALSDTLITDSVQRGMADIGEATTQESYK